MSPSPPRPSPTPPAPPIPSSPPAPRGGPAPANNGSTQSNNAPNGANGNNNGPNANTNPDHRAVNALKRKTPPSDTDPDADADAEADTDDVRPSSKDGARPNGANMNAAEADVKPIILPPGATLPAGEYETGRVICEVCGGGVSFRDEGAGGGGAFTLKHWEAHRLTCGGGPPHPPANGNGNGHPRSPHHQNQHVYDPHTPASASYPAHASHPSHSAPHHSLHAHPSHHPHPNAHQHQNPGPHHHSLAQQNAPQHHSLVLRPDQHQHHSLAPPAKRRRAKRTEEERIEYLRADPHVAQFEAYRVLCASCDKWIRLRPNSTYCSIPWDAHRKSCLAKKTNAKNAYALDERTALFDKDPDVRKFDAERLLCGMCDNWLTTPPDDHLGAVQTWVQHRATCQKTVSALKNVIANASMAEVEERKPVISPPPAAGPSTSHRAIRPSSPSTSRGPPPQHSHIQQPAPPPQQQQQQQAHSAPPGSGRLPTHLPLPDAPHLLLDLSPANYAAPHESRRRNAEQRAATLRADVLIREVEPNRVFCSLCTKWVQLRQDSSYCAYPWLQHRGKCLARYQRRAQKASEIASLKSKRPSARGGEEQHGQQHRASEDGDEPESEEGVVDVKRHPRDTGRAHHHQQQAPSHHRRGPQPQQHPPRAIPPGYAAARPMKEWQQQQLAQAQQQQSDVDAEGDADDVDADGDSYMEDESATPSRGGPYGAYGSNGYAAGNSASAILRRAVPASLADLDSPAGRRNFVFASVEYLFRTTFEASDDMSVSALLTYLNAAMPTDKHEDFDTGEVVRAATALAQREKERFALEGDMLRLLHESG